MLSNCSLMLALTSGLFLDHLSVSSDKSFELIILKFEVVTLPDVVISLFVDGFKLLQGTILGRLQVTLKQIFVKTVQVSFW